MDNVQNIQWFPGHMAKTKRRIAEQLKIIDAVAEITDARTPISSRNPDLNEIIGDKPHMILLNKCDMADPAATADWIEYYKNNNIIAIAVDCKSGKGTSVFKEKVKELLGSKLEEYRNKGMIGKPLRIMAVGIPNVGKSSFINKISGNRSAKVENRPGVTRGNQWFTIDKELELLDTPGVLWPKFEDDTVGEHLAFTGAVKDVVADTELLSVRLLELMNKHHAENLEQRYKITLSPDMQGFEILEQIGRKRGMLISGGEVDTERASVTVLDEFRGGKLGRITLELPEDA